MKKTDRSTTASGKTPMFGVSVVLGTSLSFVAASDPFPRYSD